MNQTPCDTQIRTLLDPMDPASLRPAFKALLAQAQQGKVLEDYVFFDGHYLASVFAYLTMRAFLIDQPQSPCCTRLNPKGPSVPKTLWTR